MTWFAAIPVFVVAIAVLYLPGFFVAYAAGARRFLLYVAAPAVSTALLATIAIVLPYISVSWSVLTVGISVVLIAGITAVVRRLIAGTWAVKPQERGSSTGAWTIGALALSAGIISVQLLITFGHPASMSQTFDAAFHLNGVKFMLDTANASSFHLTGLILPEGKTSFYPAAWHAIVTLVAASSGGNILVAANMVNLVIAALVWPSGALLLTRVIVPGNRAALLTTGVLAAAFPGFPLLPLDYGVLYPYFLSLAFLPSALALALGFTRLVAKGPDVPWPVRLAALVASLVGMGLSQPAGMFAWAALLVPVAFAIVLKVWRTRESMRMRIPLILGSSFALIGFLGAWYVVGKVGNSAPWDAYASIPFAVFELMTSSRENSPVFVTIGILVIAGLMSIVRDRRKLWLAGMWFIAALLFVVSASLPFGDIRNIALGVFYKDPPRLTAVLAIVSVPIAVIGALAVWRFLVTRLWPTFSSRLSPGARPRAALVGSASALAVLVAVTQGSAMQMTISIAQSKYAETAWSPILSIDEKALLMRIDKTVPANAVIVGNPWTGTSLAYAIGNRRVLNPHFNVSNDPLHVLINMHLNEAADDPAVCDALKQTGVGYVLDFGIYTRDAGGVLSFDSTVNYRGLLDLANSGVVEEVDREGDKVLYRITACD